MEFTSIYFLFGFLPIVLAIYYLIPSKYRNMLIVLASVYFYCFVERGKVDMILFYAALNYVVALSIEHCSMTARRKTSKAFLIAGILGGLLPLYFYKHMNFINGSINIY